MNDAETNEVTLTLRWVPARARGEGEGNWYVDEGIDLSPLTMPQWFSLRRMRMENHRALGLWSWRDGSLKRG